MTNISAMSVPRSQSIAPNSTTFHLPNDIEDMIEKIESLRLARDCESSNRSLVLVGRLDEIHDLDDLERDAADAVDDDDDDLIERGPIKSQYCSLTRDQPYWTNVERSRPLPANETFSIDYDKTAKQILCDKDCSEKLNACLDQLQDNVESTNCSYDGNGKNPNASHVCSLKRDFSSTTPTIVGNITNDDLLLLENVLCGAFQAAQHATEKSFLYSRGKGVEANETEETEESCLDISFDGGAKAPASNFESCESSRSRSPVFSNSTQSPDKIHESYTHGQASSPRVTATSVVPYRAAQISSYSSSCSSSSSNQSYGDTPSPNGSYRTATSSRIGERFEDDFENFSPWRHDRETTCCPIDNTNADNTSGNGNNNETGNELWSKVIEELVSNLEGEKVTKVGETHPRDSSEVEIPANASFAFLDPNELERSVSRNFIVERYSECFNHANSNVCPNSDNSIDNENAIATVEPSTTFSWSDPSYSTARINISQKDIQSVETTNPIEIDYASVNAPLLSDYPKDDGEPDGIVERLTKTRNSDIPRESDFCSFVRSFVRSFDDFSPSGADSTLDVTNLAFDLFKTKIPKNSSKDDLRIPKMVASFESCSRQRCNSDRGTTPWLSLNLPSVKASDRLKEKLNSREVEKAMISLLKRSVKELAKQDTDGDTALMCLVGNPDELVQKMAYLVPLVERLSTIPGGLTITNDRGEDALYLAALNCPQFPFVAGYLAATMVEKGIDVSQRLYHTRGDTLIHSIAAQGDSHEEILNELLALKTIQGNELFDLSKRNYDGRTAVHIAIESHEPFTKGIASLTTVKLLLKYGADPRIKETKCGDNALHMAVSFGCDPALVKLLLESCTSDLVNAVNYNHDTALHIATAMSNSVSLERQKEICWLLIQAGARTNLANRQGKTPLALVSSERKEVFRKIFYKRS